MVFSETIIPPGKILFKGFEMGPRACRALLHDTSIFFLTENKYMARGYGSTCAFRTKRTLRLFDLSIHNIKLLLKLYPLSAETKTLLKVVTGVDISVGQQKNAIREILGSPDAKNLGVKTTNARRGHRLSYKDIDKVVFAKFSEEFLKPEKYDGYYAPGRRSAFHSGQFHSEIMLNNAYQSIERATPNRLPVVSTTNIKWLYHACLWNILNRPNVLFGRSLWVSWYSAPEAWLYAWPSMKRGQFYPSASAARPISTLPSRFLKRPPPRQSSRPGGPYAQGHVGASPRVCQFLEQ